MGRADLGAVLAARAACALRLRIVSYRVVARPLANVWPDLAMDRACGFYGRFSC